MQNDETGSAFLLPSSMTSNKAVSCKEWPTEETYHQGRKAYAGGPLMLASQGKRKWKQARGSIFLLAEPEAASTEKTISEALAEESVLTHHEQRSALLPLT